MSDVLFYAVKIGLEQSIWFKKSRNGSKPDMLKLKPLKCEPEEKIDNLMCSCEPFDPELVFMIFPVGFAFKN